MTAADSELQLIPGGGQHSRRRFRGVSHSFGINHAAVTTPVLYQNILLGDKLGNADNATLYLVTVLVSLIAASPMVDRIGAHNGLTVSMAFYAAHAILFAAAIIAEDTWQWILGVGSSFIGGVGAGLMWTSQGVLFTDVSNEVAEAEGREKEQVTSELAAAFAVAYLGWEAALRALSGVLMLWLEWNGLESSEYLQAIIFLGYGVVAGIAAIGFQVMRPSHSRSHSSDVIEELPMQKSQSKILEAASLWSDPLLWRVQLFNITFGVGSAFFVAFVGPRILAKGVSHSAVGFAGAAISLIGGFGSKIFGSLSTRIGKLPVMVIGAVSFGSLGLLSAFGPVDCGDKTLLYSFPVLNGLGRAVFEGTNRAVVADFFPGPQSSGAFANSMLFSTFASVVVFTLLSLDMPSSSIVLLVGSAALTYPCLLLAAKAHRRGEPVSTSEC